MPVGFEPVAPQPGGTGAAPSTSAAERTLQASQQLLAAEPATRLAAAQQLQKSAKPAQLELLNARVAGEQDDSVRAALALTLAQSVASSHLHGPIMAAMGGVPASNLCGMVL